MDYILSRLKEPSTYAGLGLLLSALGLHISDTQVNAIAQGAMAIAGVAAAFVPEGKKT